MAAAACANRVGSASFLGESNIIDEGMFVDINGLEQWITIRGQGRDNPVMLNLHGGPGAATSGMAPVFAESEKYVTRVTWDQPGGGATFIHTKDQGELTAARFVRDGLTVADYVRKRLGAKKIILSGASFGTRLGVEMIQRQPDMFSAFVGHGQIVGQRGARLRFDLALQKARERGDTAAVAKLERAGPPPFKSLVDYFVCQQYANPPGLPPGEIEKAAGEVLDRILNAPRPPGAKYIAYPGNSGINAAAFMATQAAMFDESQRWEIRDLGRDFKVPVFVFQGERDINAPAVLAREWVEEIRAPAKAFELVPGAGHNPAPFALQYLTLLRLHVLPIVRA